MTNPTLAPEDDEHDFQRIHRFAGSPGNTVVLPKGWTEMQKLRLRFDPHKVGFGILAQPGGDDAAPAGDGVSTDTISIAMRYLIDGKDLRGRGEKK